MIVQPYQVYVERTDARKNMARYYAMDISETLFGETLLTRRWGRIGARGQSKAHLFDCEEDAVLLFLDLVNRKRARGYRPAAKQPKRGQSEWISADASSSPVPAGLQGDPHFDENRNLDQELEARLSAAEEVAG